MLIVRRPPPNASAHRGAVVALGNFDGVHRGHQALLAETCAIAAREHARPGAIIFEPHPQRFFRKDAEPFRLTPFRPKTHLLQACGIEHVFALPFDAAMARTSAEDFIRNILVRDLGVRHVITGADFLFGKGRAGNVALLSSMGRSSGLGVTIFRTIASPAGTKISSTLIRNALREGRMDDAGWALGHWWTVEGRVQPGDKRGRTIGFPTANVSLKDYIEPALGVYAVRVKWGEGASARVHDGVANFGRRPTFDKKDVLLEVHLFDYAGDLYGQHIAVSFISHLRSEQKFSGLDALKAQIARDAETAREILARSPARPPI